MVMEQTERRVARRVGCGLALMAVALLFHPDGTMADGQDPGDAARRIKSAFDERSSRGLGPSLSSQGRIRVDLPSLAPQAGGLLSSSQFTYLLDDLFRRNPVTNFTLEKMPEPEQGSAATVLARLETLSSSGRRLVTSLHIGLALEEEGWIVREFRERRRPSS